MGSDIEALFEETRRFPPPPEFASHAGASAQMYERAAADYVAFWAEWARKLEWIRPFTKTLEWNEPFARWFADGELNVSANCLDRHVRAGRGDKVAFYFEGEPGDRRTITYRALLEDVGRFANALRSLGIRKGDRVAIYMPMIPELPVALLACARIGAAHSVIFGGFSPESIVDRVNDAECVALITADYGWRRGNKVPLKQNCDVAMERTPSIRHCIVARRIGDDVFMKDGRDIWWDEAIANQTAECAPEPMGAEDLLFLLYTSGTTAKPKGIKHTTGGLSDARHDDARNGLRSAARYRYLLVHGRYRLGHRSFVYRVRTVGQRRNQRALRRHARLSRQGSILGDRRALRRNDSLHRADGDSHVHEVGHRVSGASRPFIVAFVGIGRRTDQSRSMDVVSRMDRRQSHAGRGHVVANGDRRHHDRAACPASRRCCPAARRNRCPAFLPTSSTIAANRFRSAAAVSRAHAAVAGDAARHLGRRRTLRADVLVEVSASLLRRRRRAAATPKATIGSWAGSTT